ncbi:peptidoglycan-binding protein [Streptomyces sp. NBC_01255]|uniref:peptidoglycan-binding domain-containing protein n=1 Tax=Streptomyces sp. NBC_01255 TaxID=2903798 RepID=UPI002E33C2E0|nr:peptidoglycan-binding domain-containing protein [Streptomyces sp. NBC_01255]
MTGHVCPECGGQRPGCTCAQAELAAAEDFDPLRIRPYVTLDATDPSEPVGAEGHGGHGGSAGPGGPGGSYAAEDPPTARLAAIRPDDPTPAHPGTYSDTYSGAYSGTPSGAYSGTHSDAYSGTPSGAYSGTHSGAHLDPDLRGDPSETMPLLLHGIGRITDPDPADDREPGRGRRRGMIVAAVAAVAVAGTAALAAAVLGGGDETDDRAGGLEITTSASLNVAVSEAPSPSASSETPKPSSSPPSARPTSASASPSATPTPSASRTTASPSASTTGSAAPPAATATAAPTATSASASPPDPTPSAPTATPSSQDPETEEAAVTLSLGSTGPEVRELQRRLAALWIYDGNFHGRYDEEVQEAVAVYQQWLYPREDPEGVYGPSTRSHLEQATPDF